MHVRSIASVGICVALSFFFLGIGSVDAVPIKTRSLKTIDIRPEIDGAQMTGKAWLKNTLSNDIGDISWSITDSFGAEVWTQQISWNDSFLFHSQEYGIPQIVIPFSYDFSQKNIAGDFNLHFRITSQLNASLIAQGHQKIVINQDKDITRISNLRVEKDNQMQTAFLVWQDTDSLDKELSFVPIVTVFEHEVGEKIFFSAKGDIQTLTGKEKKEIEFSFPVPDVPKKYIVEVKAVAENGERLTGTLIKPFLIDGDFVHIRAMDAEPETFIDPGNKIHLFIAGTTRNNRDPLTFTVNGEQISKGEVHHTFSETREVNEFDFDEFETLFSFDVVEPGASTFHFTVDVSQNGSTIETKTLRTENYRSPLERQVQHQFNLWSNLVKEKWFIYSLLALLVVAGFFIIFSHHKHKPFHDRLGLWLFIPFLLWGGMSLAAPSNTWTEPTDNTAANPAASGDFTDFRSLAFSGTLIDGASGLLQPDVSQVNVLLYDGGNQVVGQTGFFVLTDNELSDSEGIIDAAYTFVVNTNSAFGAVPDGVYIPQIQFDLAGDGFEESTDLETTNTTSIVLDTTVPTNVSFLYDGKTRQQVTNEEYFTNEAVTLTVLCDDGASGTAGCFFPNAATSFATFPVVGNFCDRSGGRSFCDNKTIEFEVCDRVGNCIDSNDLVIDIDFYDSEPPSINLLELINGVTNEDPGRTPVNVIGAQGEAHEKFVFRPEIDDPETASGLVHEDPCDYTESGKQIIDVTSPSRCTPKTVPCVISLNPYKVGQRDVTSSSAQCLEEDDPPQPTCSFTNFPYCFPILFVQ